MELTICNFRRGANKNDCSMKYEGTTPSGDLSRYGDCDGEQNCMLAYAYKAFIKLAENQKR